MSEDRLQKVRDSLRFQKRATHQWEKGYVISYVRVVCRDREERLAALSAAQQEAMEELQKKIQMKATCSISIPYNSTVSIPAFDLGSVT